MIKAQERLSFVSFWSVLSLVLCYIRYLCIQYITYRCKLSFPYMFASLKLAYVDFIFKHLQCLLHDIQYDIHLHYHFLLRITTNMTSTHGTKVLQVMIYTGTKMSLLFMYPQMTAAKLSCKAICVTFLIM